MSDNQRAAVTLIACVAFIAAAVIGTISFAKLGRWAEAEVEIATAPYISPTTNAVRGEVLSGPDDPMLVSEGENRYRLYGTASWYDYTFNPDGGTRPCFISKGETCYTEGHRVAAMRDVERYTTVRVTRLDTGKSVEVLITDYGPDKELHPGRVIDLSSAAFRELADLNTGLVEVMVEWEGPAL